MYERPLKLTPYEELFGLAKKLGEAASTIESDNITQPMNALEEAANKVHRSFSGSWLGYHSRVYHAGLSPAPPGANFSQEWGLKRLASNVGTWREFDSEDVIARIYQMAGEPDLDDSREAAGKAQELFDSSKSEILSILTNELDERADGFLVKLTDDLERLEPMSKADFEQHWSPKGEIMTRDTLALGQGIQAPPHIAPLAEVATIRHSFDICGKAAEISRKAASHLERKSRRKKVADRIGTNVFIGHGRSTAWRELKDFVQDRLSLPWDEFNRVPVAGVPNTTRLSEMLDVAAIALLVMTAEDEMADGGVQARMNVIHEAGLFQGRLGFTKAIVLLEEGCEEFSNIQGLGQVQFPKGNIAASFEEIRRVLEREGLLSVDE